MQMMRNASIIMICAQMYADRPRRKWTWLVTIINIIYIHRVKGHAVIGPFKIDLLFGVYRYSSTLSDIILVQSRFENWYVSVLFLYSGEDEEQRVGCAALCIFSFFVPISTENRDALLSNYHNITWKILHRNGV